MSKQVWLNGELIHETPAPEGPENLLSNYLYAVGTITLTIAVAIFLKKRYL